MTEFIRATIGIFSFLGIGVAVAAWRLFRRPLSDKGSNPERRRTRRYQWRNLRHLAFGNILLGAAMLLSQIKDPTRPVTYVTIMAATGVVWMAYGWRNTIRDMTRDSRGRSDFMQ